MSKANPQATSPLRSRFIQHKQAMRRSINQVWTNSLSTWITLAAIAIALSLPAGLYILLNNLKTLTDDKREIPTISVFIKQGISEQQAQDRAELLVELPDILKVQLIPREEGLKRIQQITGFAETLEALDDNPLPHVLVVTPRMNLIGDPGIDLESLADKINGLPEVDTVQMDIEWVLRLRAILRVAERTVLVVGVLLALTVLLVVGNTIRLNIENRREEVEVSQLVGATPAFIRRPFLYSGLWYGFFGGVMSLVIVHLSLIFLIGPVNDMAKLYGSYFSISGLGPVITLVILAVSSLLGLIGAWLAVSRHLRRQLSVYSVPG